MPQSIRYLHSLSDPEMLPRCMTFGRGRVSHQQRGLCRRNRPRPIQHLHSGICNGDKSSNRTSGPWCCGVAKCDRSRWSSPLPSSMGPMCFPPQQLLIPWDPHGNLPVPRPSAPDLYLGQQRRLRRKRRQVMSHLSSRPGTRSSRRRA